MKLKKYTYDGTKELVLSEVKTGAPKSAKEMREELTQKTAENIAAIALLQDKLYAANKEGLIFVLQARDAAGKDSTIKHIMTGLNPQGIDVFSFKSPSKEELAHPFLWRFYKAMPERGKIAIFNRSYYEDVLAARVLKLDEVYQMPERTKGEKFFKKRYKHINNFEDMLYDNGYQIIKVFLNVSKETQKERFLERIDRPEKNWKFSVGDLPTRELWDEYTEVYEAMVNECASKECPWYVIPADNKWYARYLISEILLERLQEMDPQYPEMPEEEKIRLSEVREKLMSEDQVTE